MLRGTLGRRRGRSGAGDRGDRGDPARGGGAGGGQVGYAELLSLSSASPHNRYRLAIFQQITGINTVIYYAPTTLEAAGFSPGGAIVATSFGVGVVNVGFTILAVWLIDRWGTQTAAPDRGRWYGREPVSAGVGLRARGRFGLARGLWRGVFGTLHSLLRDKPGAGLLADDLGDLPLEHPRQGHEHGFPSPTGAPTGSSSL